MKAWRFLGWFLVTACSILFVFWAGYAVVDLLNHKPWVDIGFDVLLAAVMVNVAGSALNALDYT